MALYIHDKKIIDTFIKISTHDIAIKMIMDFISDKDGEYPKIEYPNGHWSEEDSILILTNCWCTTDLVTYTRKDITRSNTVGISKNEIYINPTLDRYRNNYTSELFDFILSVPSIIREKKIKKIL